mmetsp:Transcript_4477/g.9758  ORF Transcript_4477/g.9758 Transcript_4477/m.9758 type:complete len:247 (+) Transcript_4477:3-743(+)
MTDTPPSSAALHSSGVFSSTGLMSTKPDLQSTKIDIPPAKEAERFYKTPRPEWEPEDDLPEDKLTEIRTAFGAFDRGGSGSVSLLDVPMVLRSVGINLSEAEVSEFVELFEEGKTVEDPDASAAATSCTFHQFCLLTHYKLWNYLGVDATGTPRDETDRRREMEAELIASFKAFDTQAEGVIKVEDFRKIMTEYGEPLSEEQLDEILKEAEMLMYIKERTVEKEEGEKPEKQRVLIYDELARQLLL